MANSATLTCLGQNELLVSNSNVVPGRAVVAAKVPVGHRSHLEAEIKSQAELRFEHLK